MVGTVFVALVAATALTPTAALAQRAPGGGRGMSAGQGAIGVPSGRVPGQRFAHGSFGPGAHGHHRFGHGHHGRFAGFAPSTWYAPGPYYYPQAVYDTRPVYTYAPPMYNGATLAPSRPMSTVVEYPTGRYELRGDGYVTPYHWIWIPNAPPAPPTPASPAHRPEPAGPPASAKAEPPAKTTVYRWTDTEGVLHFTDQLDSVPLRYRAQARSARPS